MAFEKLIEFLQIDDVTQAEMLFTHLPTALTRISQGEEVDGPSEEILAEIILSNYYSLAKQQVEYIEGIWEMRYQKRKLIF